MSVIHLDSNGQNPAEFFNVFPQGIHLGRKAQICVKGYAGLLNQDITTQSSVTAGSVIAGAGAGLPRYDEDFQVVQKGQNDEFTIYHGELVPTAPGEAQQHAFHIQVQPAQYTDDGLAAEVQDDLNNAENNCSYVGGWAVTAAGGQFRINQRCMSNVVEVGGDWEETQGIGTVVNGVGNSVLTPVVNGGHFINKQRGFLGNPRVAVAPAFLGYTWEFDLVAGTAISDIPQTMGIVPFSQATQYSRLAPKPGNSSSRDLSVPLSRVNEQPNLQVDWAAGQIERAWATYAFVVRESDGAVGILESDMRAPDGSGMLKNSGTQTIEWFPGTLIATGGALNVKLCICPRYDTVSDLYTLDFGTDIGAGAYTSLATRRIGSFFAGDNSALMSAVSAHQVTFYQNSKIAVSSLPVTCSSLNPDGANQAVPAGPGLNGYESTTLVFRYIVNDAGSGGAGLEILQQEVINYSNRHANALGQTLGYPKSDYTEASTSTVGWRERDVNPQDITGEDGPPFIITCPDLPVKGYIGAATGGGQIAPIIGIGLPRANNDLNAFQSEGGDMWVKLNNEYPIRINQLNIRLVDSQYITYKRLMPNFSMWIMVKCEGREDEVRSETVDRLNNYNRIQYPE